MNLWLTLYPTLLTPLRPPFFTINGTDAATREGKFVPVIKSRSSDVLSALCMINELEGCPEASCMNTVRIASPCSDWGSWNSGGSRGGMVAVSIGESRTSIVFL